MADLDLSILPESEFTQTRIAQKRNRPQLNCTFCRQGKLRCNRAHPCCDQCLKRSRGESCIYVPSAVRIKRSQNLRSRIKHLEAVVRELMPSDVPDVPDGTLTSFEERRQPPKGINHTEADSRWSHENIGGPSSVDDRTADHHGRMRINEKETSYTGFSHWATILGNIAEVSRCLDEEDSATSEEDEPNVSLNVHAKGPLDMFGDANFHSRDDLLGLMPDKSLVDHLVSMWFNSYDPTIYLIHTPTFQEEYKRFWEDPQRTPLMWIGMLYGIMSISTILHVRSGQGEISPEKAMDQANKFQGLARSAAILGDCTKGLPYTLECLILYSGSEYVRNQKSQVNVWTMVGLIVRLAMRMGYHRDARHYHNITPFQGEMRRRTWHFIYQIDVLLSFQLGLPGMIRDIQSDTGPPHNLRDGDFDIGSRALPEPRPESDLTPVSYPIAKHRICSVFAKAAELSHAFVEPSYVEVMQLDHDLEQSYALVPAMMRIKSMEQSITDDPSLIMSRFNIELLYQKTRAVLHRRFMAKAEVNSCFDYSRRSCVDAALKTLRHHADIYHSTSPGGQLSQVRWYMASLTTHDFILAAMVICLELEIRGGAGLGASGVESIFQGPSVPEAEEIIKAVEVSHHIWQTSTNVAPEARRASKALSLMLKVIKDRWAAKRNEHEVVPDRASRRSLMSPENTFVGFDPQPEQNAIPGSMSSIQDFAEGDTFTPLESMLEMPLNIDWELWDSYVNNSQQPSPSDGRPRNNDPFNLS